MAEEQFQSGQVSLKRFLSEEISADPEVNISSFTELIIFVTICGRCLSHKQQATVEPVYGSVSREFWERHQWLHSLLTTRLGDSSLQPILHGTLADPLRLFAKFVAHTTMIYLCRIPESLPWEEPLKMQIISECHSKERVAALKIVELTQYLDQVGILKV